MVEQVINVVCQMYVEEFFVSFWMCKFFCKNYYGIGIVNCCCIEKGFRKIDEFYLYYEIKYFVNYSIMDFVDWFEVFLKMMKVEEEGLVEICVEFSNECSFRKNFY